jgi:hypothetical protein
MKQLRWYNTLALLDVELIQKPRWDNNRKKKLGGNTFNQDSNTKGHLPRGK